MLCSVIIPVYNNENIIQQSISSLENQTLNKDLFEVIVIDDNSTDKTFNIVEDYIKHSCLNINLIKNNKKGVSSARNLGIESSKGKYLFYLDSDDFYSNNTLKNVCYFFENYENNIDLILLKTISINKNGKQQAHWRDEHFKNTGIYSLSDVNSVILSNVTVCVKQNLNVRWDENLSFHEDEKYNTEILSIKKKFGYIKDCVYFYRKSDEQITKSKLTTDYIFDQSIALYSSLFKTYPDGEMNIYVQNLVLNDLEWKLCSNVLWPKHLEGKKYKKACKKIFNLIKHIDVKNILAHKHVSLSHKHYFLSLKDKKDFHIKTINNSICIVDDTNFSYRIIGNELFIEKIFFCNKNYIEMSLLLKTMLSNYVNIEFLVKETVNDIVYERKLELVQSAYSYDRCRTLTNKFFKVVYKRYLIDNEDVILSFYIKVGEKKYPISSNIKQLKTSPFYTSKRSIQKLIKNGVEISLNKNEIRINNKYIILNKENNILDKELFNLSIKKYVFRQLVKKLRNNKNIWLYVDNNGIFDNSYCLYLQHKNINDGVSRYYVVYSEQDATKLNLKKNEYIIFGSLKHQLYFLLSRKIFTSFIDYEFFNPISKQTFNTFYYDISDADIIYVTHGVLHAKTLHYMQEFTEVNKFLYSTSLEKEALISLGYSENMLIESLMPRLGNSNSRLDKDNLLKIAFVTSWRNYLVKNMNKDKKYEVRDDYLTDKYINSIISLLNNLQLDTFLKAHNAVMHVKLHPILSSISLPINNRLNNIQLVSELDPVNSYDLCVTDFSSILYDFCYYNIPVMIYFPDRIKFISRSFYNDFYVNLKKDFLYYSENYNDFINYIKNFISLYKGHEKINISPVKFNKLDSDIALDLYKKVTDKTFLI